MYTTAVPLPSVKNVPKKARFFVSKGLPAHDGVLGGVRGGQAGIIPVVGLLDNAAKRLRFAREGAVVDLRAGIRRGLGITRRR